MTTRKLPRNWSQPAWQSSNKKKKNGTYSAPKYWKKSPKPSKLTRQQLPKKETEYGTQTTPPPAQRRNLPWPHLCSLRPHRCRTQSDRRTRGYRRSHTGSQKVGEAFLPDRS